MRLTAAVVPVGGGAVEPLPNRGPPAEVYPWPIPTSRIRNMAHVVIRKLHTIEQHGASFIRRRWEHPPPGT